MCKRQRQGYIQFERRGCQAELEGEESHKQFPVGSTTATDESRVGTGSTQNDVEGRIKLRWLAVEERLLTSAD